MRGEGAVRTRGYPEVQASVDDDGDQLALQPNVNLIEPLSSFGDPALLARRAVVAGNA
jgi:hypothetical protein